MALFEIRNLTFTYPDQEKPALTDLNFSLKQKGQILFEGRELDAVSVREQGARIGYVLQSPDNQLVTDKVWHELAFGLENLGYETGTIRLRVAEMASFFGIQTWFEKNVEELSGGQKQLLNLAAVMAMQPDLLVLDEPTSQLDPLAAGDFLATLRKINAELGTTILLIEHRLEEVLAYADRVLVMENGGILAMDKPEKLPSLIRDNDMFQAMPVPMRIFEELSGEGDSPVTVREGREWLEEWREEKKTSENSCKNQAETVEKMSDDRDRELAEKLSDTQESETVDTPEKGRKTSLFGLFSKKSAKGSDDQQPQTVLEARDVWFRYEKELPDVVRDLNLKVQKGELYCLLGGNGTGKSTTLRLLGRIKKPYRGKLFLNGKELGTYRESELYGKLLGILQESTGRANFMENFSVSSRRIRRVCLSRIRSKKTCGRCPGIPNACGMSSKRQRSGICWEVTRMTYPAGNSSGPPWRKCCCLTRRSSFWMNRQRGWMDFIRRNWHRS